ncbi:NfeD family protein [Undibacter mobilis]|uniref:NfeD family protein n=1 Tax=Undibacter mobilis TaxID=2292256 RepID=A0A371B0E5_9BRAD|nr:NfeD family protein [Undibacter mobilis]RDV01069.1 NfeD family protein [Undibacter mobilis]
MTGAISPWVWAVAAVVIAFLELPVPGNYLIWFACAAALTALVGFAIDWTLNAQLAFFSAACLISCVAGYFVYRRLALRGPDTDVVNRRDLELVGQSGLASEAFVNGHGRIRLNDTLWLAEGDEDFAAGTALTITAVHGTSLVVRRK